MSYTVTKSTVVCYKIREKALGWADITIDAGEQSGRIQIASDFGDWQYYWSHCGEPFKQFLIGLNKHYTAGKFKVNKHFDLDNNIQALRHELYEQFCVEGTISQHIHDAAMAELNEIAETCSNNLYEFWQLLKETTVLYSDVAGYDWETTTCIEPGFECFWREIWPPFIEQLKSETTKTTQP